MKNEQLNWRSPAALAALARGDLGNALVAATPGGIEAQETAGQRKLVTSDVLPTEIGRYSGYDERALLESWGVRFLGPVEGDPLFQRVKLPAGWTKEPTGHSMWSKLLDEKGRERAAIGYKAAFYDRWAHMRLCTRYATRCDYDKLEAEGVVMSHVTDAGTIIHSTEPAKPEDQEHRYAALDAADAAAKAWLNEHFPDWQNPGAYWET